MNEDFRILLSCSSVCKEVKVKDYRPGRSWIFLSICLTRTQWKAKLQKELRALAPGPFIRQESGHEFLLKSHCLIFVLDNPSQAKLKQICMHVRKELLKLGKKELHFWIFESLFEAFSSRNIWRKNTLLLYIFLWRTEDEKKKGGKISLRFVFILFLFGWERARRD